jgi:hypothetical protein
MLFQVLLAIIVAKLKGYRIWKALVKPAFYPFYIVEITHIIFQVNIFLQNYSVISYAPYLKTASLYTLLLPIFVYKLYLPALAGSGFIITGTVLNEIVKHANGGKMPVYPTLSRLTGYYRDGMLENSPLHVLINSETKLKILSDYIDVGYSILSIGDLFIHFFVCIVFFYGIKAISKKSFGGTKLESNT